MSINVVNSIPTLDFYVTLTALYLDIHHVSSSIHCIMAWCKNAVSKWHVKRKKKKKRASLH